MTVLNSEYPQDNVDSTREVGNPHQRATAQASLFSETLEPKSWVWKRCGVDNGMRVLTTYTQTLQGILFLPSGSVLFLVSHVSRAASRERKQIVKQDVLPSLEGYQNASVSTAVFAKGGHLF